MDTNNMDSIIKKVIEEVLSSNKASLSVDVNQQGKCSTCSMQSDYDAKLASAMEHSMIRPDATPAMVKQFCDEAKKYNFRNVAVPPCFVTMAAELLKGTGIRISTAVSFPMGITTTKMKVAETHEVIENGASEIDLPVNVGMVKAGELKAVKEDIEAVVAASNGRALIKAVVDLGALTEEEKIKVALIAKMAGADFLKVASVTRPTGVNADDMILMRKVVGKDMGLKADGGIKDYKTAIAVIEAGGTTIGASGSVKIVTKA